MRYKEAKRYFGRRSGLRTKWGLSPKAGRKARRLPWKLRGNRKRTTSYRFKRNR